MTILKTTTSCEINDLMDAVIEKTNNTFDVVEKQFFKSYLYPEGTKTYVSTRFRKDGEGENQWLYDAIYSIMDDNNITAMYITEEI
jgi:hypothetical protein